MTNTDQAIKKFSLTGRIIKFVPLSPWSKFDLFFVLSVKTKFNLQKQSHHATVVNLLGGQEFVVEIDNGFALALFSKIN